MLIYLVNLRWHSTKLYAIAFAASSLKSYTLPISTENCMGIEFQVASFQLEDGSAAQRFARAR